MYANQEYSLSGIGQLKMNSTDLRILAAKAFEQAYNRGRLSQLWARISGRDNRLKTLSYQPISSEKTTSHIVSISINQIKGSVGRSTDFDSNFNPLKEHCRTRWVNILTVMLQGVTLPPVELVKVDKMYYVRDGHHRISVARRLGQLAIEARIVN